MKQLGAGPQTHNRGQRRVGGHRELKPLASFNRKAVADGATVEPVNAHLQAHVRYWQQRLVRRIYGRWTRPFPFKELSVRLEHEGAGFFFPLGTGAEAEAARRAWKLNRQVSIEGWPSVFQKYSREFTLAIFWGENPMVFTYTTLYTVPESSVWPGPALVRPNPRPSTLCIAVVESDLECARALGDWVRSLPGCTCGGLFSKGTEALQAFKNRPVNLVLFNRQLPDVQFIHRLSSGPAYLPTLGYRIYNTSDELFVSQPGVSGGYYFRRRPPKDLLEPIRDAWNHSQPTPDEWHDRIYGYVQRLFLAPDGPGHAGSRSPLTSREREILSCLGRGIPDKEIARALDISFWTVHTHLKRIYEKLGVHSRAKAILKFLQG